MKVQPAVLATLLTLFAAAASSAGEAIPAWQVPGFVMEEVVVTASSGYAMEEVVVTVTADDVAAARLRRLQRQARVPVAASVHGDRF